jgi:hypothetical protein
MHQSLADLSDSIESNTWATNNILKMLDYDEDLDNVSQYVQP